MSTSNIEPLILVKKIQTSSRVIKFLRLRNELLLGLNNGSLQVFDITKCGIIHKHCFGKSNSIYDILVIDETHFLLATQYGLMKTTKDKVISNYYEVLKGLKVTSLSHIDESLFLIG